MQKHSETIQKNAEGISEEVRKAKNALDQLVRKAQRTLRALNVELIDEVAERRTPIALPADMPDTAGNALPDNGEAA